MEENKKSKVKSLIEWVECIVIAIILALLIRYFVGTPTVVKQESMYPTLVQNQRLILNRLPRTTKTLPERGDIITFEAPSNSYIDDTEVNLNNPVAEYYNEPEGLINKFVYYVLEWTKMSYIKRVIGLPGDHVQIKDGKVYINDKLLDEPYLAEGVETTSLGGKFVDLYVPQGYVFAMGDNREHSSDCRRFGCIPIEKIEGKVVFRFFPFSVFGKIE